MKLCFEKKKSCKQNNNDRFLRPIFDLVYVVLCITILTLSAKISIVTLVPIVVILGTGLKVGGSLGSKCDRCL